MINNVVFKYDGKNKIKYSKISNISYKVCV